VLLGYKSFNASSLGMATIVSTSTSSLASMASFMAFFSLGASKIITSSYLPKVQ